MKVSHLFIVVMAICLGLFLYRCGGATQSFEQDISQGKTALAEGNGQEAQKFFTAALNRSPKNGQAALGLVLAIIQDIVFKVDTLINVSKNMPQEQTTTPESTAHLSIDAIIVDILQKLFIASADRIIQLIDESDMADSPDFSFTLAAYPLSLQGHELANLAGTYDLATANFIKGLAYMVAGISCYGTTLDWNFNPSLYETGSKSDDLITYKTTSYQSLKAILTDPHYPNFLRFKAGSQTDLNRAENLLATAMDVLLAVINEIPQIDSAGDDQRNHIIVIQAKDAPAHPLDAPVTQIRLDPNIIAGLETTLHAWQKSFRQNLSLDIANFSLLLTEILTSPTVIALPQDCISIPIPQYFDEKSDMIRQLLKKQVESQPEQIAALAEIQKSIRLLNQYLKANPTLQVLWKKTANSLIDTTTASAAESLAQFSDIINMLIPILRSMLLNSSLLDQESMEKYSATLELVLKILQVIADDPESYVAFLQSTGHLMLLTLEIFTAELPAPPEVLSVAEIMNIARKYIPQLAPWLSEMIPPLVTIYQALPPDLKKFQLCNVAEIGPPNQ